MGAILNQLGYIGILLVSLLAVHMVHSKDASHIPCLHVKMAKVKNTITHATWIIYSAYDHQLRNVVKPARYDIPNHTKMIKKTLDESINKDTSLCLVLFCKQHVLYIFNF